MKKTITLLIVSLYHTDFNIIGGILLDENLFERLDKEEFYQGLFIETKGFINPKINNITIIKKNGENFVDSKRLFIDIDNHTGSTSIEEFKENRDNYTLAENFIPANKEFNLIIKNDSYLRLYEIGELRIYYSLFGVKMYKGLTL